MIMVSCLMSPSHLHNMLAHMHTGLVIFILLSLFPPTRSLFDKVRSTFTQTVEQKRAVAFVVSGTILGMGMTVSGAVS